MKVTWIVLVAFLTGCVSGADSTVKTEYDSKGNIQRTSQKLSGNDYVDSQIEVTRQTCFSNAPSKSNDPLTEAIRSMGEALKVSHGWRECEGSTNSNDRKIAQSAERGKTWRFGLGMVFPWLGRWAVAKEVVDGYADRSGGGVTVNGDNNALRSTNTGDAGTAGYNEQNTTTEIPDVILEE